MRKSTTTPIEETSSVKSESSARFDENAVPSLPKTAPETVSATSGVEENKDMRGVATNYFQNILNAHDDAHGLEVLLELIKKYEDSQEKFMLDVLMVKSVSNIHPIDEIKEEFERGISLVRSYAIELEAVLAKKHKRHVQFKLLLDKVQRFAFWLLVMFILGMFAGVFASTEYVKARIKDAISVGGFVDPNTQTPYDIKKRH